MGREFDLLGDPIPDGRGEPGRTGHIATAENVNKVRLLVLADWTAKQIADELGISVPTLNKHYFRNASIKAARGHVLSEVEGRLMLQLDRKASEGSVAAARTLFDILDKKRLKDLAGKYKNPGKADASAAQRPAKPMGKKEARVQAAKTPQGGWGFLSETDETGRPN